MIRSFTLVAIVALSTVATPVHAQQRFGSGVTLTDVTPVARVLDAPETFAGRTVRVDGTVTAVCTHEGCWMAFAGDVSPEGRTLLVKVDDGVIVFPVTAKGRRASAQGVLERIGASGEAHEAAGEHARQTAAAPARWQLKATGALVY